jgi:hypothetical protein
MIRKLHVELLSLTLLAAVLGAVMAWQSGHWVWTWDALNHHVYLGLIAEQPRWSLDLMAPGSQVYQHPYLYWPIYKIAQMNASGVVVAMVWTATQAALVLPPVWLLAHRWIDTQNLPPWEATSLRAVACVLAFMNSVLLYGLGLSSNDLLASLPLLWAVALQASRSRSNGLAWGCAALWGASTALKWSNGLMIPVLLFWWWQTDRPHLGLRRALFLAAGAVIGFGLVYLPWGLQLWAVEGNPFYPYFDRLFARH